MMRLKSTLIAIDKRKDNIAEIGLQHSHRTITQRERDTQSLGTKKDIEPDTLNYRTKYEKHCQQINYDLVI